MLTVSVTHQNVLCVSLRCNGCVKGIPFICKKTFAKYFKSSIVYIHVCFSWRIYGRLLIRESV